MKNNLKELFNFGANNYDLYMDNNDLFSEERRLLNKIKKELVNKTILDVGSGTGEIAIQLSSLPGTKILGIDFSDRMITIAKKKLEKLKISNVNFKVMDVDFIPVDWSFEVVICSFVLGYLKNKVEFISKLKKNM